MSQHRESPREQELAGAANHQNKDYGCAPSISVATHPSPEKLGTGLPPRLGPAHNDREARKAQAIATTPHLREVYLDGYLRGYAEGFKQADGTAETHAEHAARLFYTMEAGEQIHRDFAKSAAEALDIHAARQAQRRGGAHA